MVFRDDLALCGGTLSRCSARLGQEGAVWQLVWILQETSIATASPSHLFLVKRHHLSPRPEVAQRCFSPFLPCDPIHLQPGFQARRVWMGQMACWDGRGGRGAVETKTVAAPEPQQLDGPLSFPPQDPRSLGLSSEAYPSRSTGGLSSGCTVGWGHRPPSG